MKVVNGRCRPRIDLAGERFGRLVVREWIQGDNGRVAWLCKCDCGSTVSAEAKYLRSGNTRSCGCLHRDEMSEMFKTHGGRQTSEYAIWCAMKRRCGNPSDSKYARYGGRGIEVCDRWKDSFEAFFADMGQRPSRRHSIDRINNDGNYEPENCRWATPKEQAQNTSRTRIITCNGRSMCLTDWAVATGLNIETIRGRLKRGRSVEEALSCA